MAKNELKRPQLPGQVDMSKVNSASANVAAARDAVNNLNYNTFKQGADYAGLKKSYEQQGQTAMKDTLGQVAARTGGMASSYATSAANQSYNNYMQTLEDAARSMFNEEYARKKDAYNMAQQEYANAYGEYRDTKSDAWAEYNALNSNFQSDRTYNYQLKRDQKSDEDAATAQAQDDILAIWKAGGTPSPELLQAAGWYDATAPDGVSVTGAAYKSEIDEEITAGKKTEGQKVVADLWATGTEPTDEQYVAAGYKTKNADNTYSWTTEGLAAYNSKHALTDSEIEAMFLADGFDWKTWLNGDKAKNLKGLDVDQDGIYGEKEDLEMFFANSNRGGAEIWQQWLADEQSRISDENTTDAQGRVSDAWAAGNTPEEKDLIAAGYIEVDDDGKAIKENGDYKYTTAGKDALANSSALGKMDMEYLLTSGTWTWGDWDRDGKVGDEDTDGESVTAKQFFSKSGGSEEAWKAWLDDYKVGNYRFKDTREGRAEIFDKLIDSNNFSLNDTDAANFDYIYGDGAYDAIKGFEQIVDRINIDTDTDEGVDRAINEYFDAYDRIIAQYPQFNEDIIDTILKKRFPKMVEFLVHNNAEE